MSSAARNLANEIRSDGSEAQFDLAGWSLVNAAKLVEEAFSTPIVALSPFRIRFTIGAGRQGRVRYDPELGKQLSASLRLDGVVLRLRGLLLGFFFALVGRCYIVEYHSSIVLRTTLQRFTPTGSAKVIAYLSWLYDYNSKVSFLLCSIVERWFIGSCWGWRERERDLYRGG